MTISLLFFGISSDLANCQSATLKLKDFATVKEMKNSLIEAFPRLANLSDFAVAINENYADEADELKDSDVVAILPPVSGG